MDTLGFEIFFALDRIMSYTEFIVEVKLESAYKKILYIIKAKDCHGSTVLYIY